MQRADDKGGDLIAEFDEFYEASKDDVLRTVLLVTRDRWRAEDAVAEAFVRAYSRWDTFRHHPNPRAWIVRTALNVHRSWWRRLRRETAADYDAAGEDRREGLDSEIVDAIRALPDRQREVVALRLVMDFDTAATADVLGIAPGTVTAHLHRATGALRTVLEAHSTEGRDQ